MSACEDIIYSDDHAEVLVPTEGEDLDTLKKRYNTECIQVVNSNFAIIYVPVTEIDLALLRVYKYLIFPPPYVLTDTTSMEASGVLRLRSQPYLNLLGKDVIIGFIDTGIDYTHPVFINADNTTRILGIWDQTMRGGNPPEGFLFGTEYTREQINQALQSENPFETVPTKDELGHGTFLAGIAAGNIDETNEFTGAAPLADIAVVKLKQMKQIDRDFYLIAKDIICYTGLDIDLGVRYLTDISEKLRKPLVICIGLGSNFGDHSESLLLSKYLNSIGLVPGITGVSAAGNEGNAKNHYYSGKVAQGKFIEVEINVAANELGFVSQMWVSSPYLFSVAFISPGGEFIEKIPSRLGEYEVIKFLFEDTIIGVDYQLVSVENGDEAILLRFERPSPGVWKIRAYNESELEADFHIWLPSKEIISEDTFFIKPDPYTTITEPGNADNVITATAYNHHDGSLYMNSGRGYSRIGDVKPDLAAPGVNVYGPVPGGGFSTMTGTSVAAAHTAGAAALLMEWGIVRGNDMDMNSSGVRKYLIRGAKRTDMIYPNREWGYGILDIWQTFESLRRTL